MSSSTRNSIREVQLLNEITYEFKTPIWCLYYIYLQVAKYKKGKKRILNLFVGGVKEATDGRGNPRIISRILKELLSQWHFTSQSFYLSDIWNWPEILDFLAWLSNIWLICIILWLIGICGLWGRWLDCLVTEIIAKTQNTYVMLGFDFHN